MVLSSNLSAPSMTTKQLGNIGEAKLVSMNIPVYVSFGDNEKADLVAEFNQFTVSLKSSTIRNQNHYYHKYNSSEIDYFVVYNLESV